MTESVQRRVLEFWFGPDYAAGDIGDEYRSRWWKKSDEFDGLCRDQFQADLDAARSGGLEALKSTAHGCLAFVILCDQLSRNMHRGTPDAFATDPLALEATQTAIESGFDAQLAPRLRAFLYMPLMHSEDADVQVQSVECFTRLAKDGVDQGSYAEQHKAIIDRFGRYPHRNDILGRASTPEELEFLKQPGSSF